MYSNPADKASSPYELENSGPIDWAWLSTINRVNSQVKKVRHRSDAREIILMLTRPPQSAQTLVLTYVTIPPLALDGREGWFCGGEAESWAQYSIRELVLRRFVPARMRD